MDRRRLLLAGTASLTTVLAGCSSDNGSGNGGGDGDGDGNGSSGGNESEGNESGENESGGNESADSQNVANAPQGENVLENNGLEITEHEVAGEEFELSVDGIAENTTDETKDYVEVRVRAYDADGNQLDSYLDNTTDLQGGGTWSFSVAILEYEEFDDYDIQVSDSPF